MLKLFYVTVDYRDSFPRLTIWNFHLKILGCLCRLKSYEKNSNYGFSVIKVLAFDFEILKVKSVLYPILNFWFENFYILRASFASVFLSWGQLFCLFYPRFLKEIYLTGIENHPIIIFFADFDTLLSNFAVFNFIWVSLIYSHLFHVIGFPSLLV